MKKVPGGQFHEGNDSDLLGKVVAATYKSSKGKGAPLTIHIQTDPHRDNHTLKRQDYPVFIFSSFTVSEYEVTFHSYISSYIYIYIYTNIYTCYINYI